MSLDGADCSITNINMSHVSCITSAHVEGTVDVRVTIGDSSADLGDAFNYSSDLTASVSSVSPQKGSVSGGEILTISGSGFGNNAEAVVTIGDASCKIQSSTESEVRCVIPPHRAGKLKIKVFIPGKGDADIPPSQSAFEYVLLVSGVCPLVGSVAGGTQLTITGKGFSDKDAQVTIGGQPCHVSSSNSSHILCETNDVFNTAQVDNSGSHPGKCIANNTKFCKSHCMTPFAHLLPSQRYVFNTDCVVFCSICLFVYSFTYYRLSFI